MDFLRVITRVLIIPLFLQLPLFSRSEHLYSSCAGTFNCGQITGIGYPFRSISKPENCGHPDLVLNCKNKIATIEINTLEYRVLSINEQAQTMKLVREDLINSNCPQKLISTNFENTIFELNSNYINLTFVYGCDSPILMGNFLTVDFCNVSGYETVKLLSGGYIPILCRVPVTIPVDGWDFTENLTDLGEALRRGFELKWTVDDGECDECIGSNGRCGFDNSPVKGVCFCPYPPYVASTSTCAMGNGSPSTTSRKLGWSKAYIGLFIAGVVFGCLLLAFAIFAIFVCRKRRNRNATKSMEFRESRIENIPFSHLSNSTATATTSSTSLTDSTNSFPSTTYDTGKSTSYFGVKVFDYAELEEATDHFHPSREIGDGGFGTVFFGKLNDGREVAVKRLYKNNFKRITQYMNEIEILTRLNHVNLVKLYGCTSRQSRELLLIYEYIPNGTISDHLHGEKAKPSLLTWPLRLNIAIETAEALVYLHKSEIIHRDVKTTNILLDNDFRVKVADFGLSRLFPNNVTHVSTNPQGTPGYVDPEYHQCYHLTDKSDVYSFGVVLVELISSKQAVDITRDRHDINLSNMAVNKIQNGKLNELVDFSLGFGKNKSIEKMIRSVAELAFRCLQNERDMRPSMEEILEGLKRIKNDENATKFDGVEIVIGDEAALLKNSSPPFSPNSVIGNKWVSNATTPSNSR